MCFFNKIESFIIGLSHHDRELSQCVNLTRFDLEMHALTIGLEIILLLACPDEEVCSAIGCIG